MDIAGLNQAERAEGSFLLGGSAAEFIVPGDRFEYNQIHTVLFKWGDPKAEALFSVMLEHDDTPDRNLFPFSAAAVIGNQLWSLAVQSREFEPHLAYASDNQYIVLPFDEHEGLLALYDFLTKVTPRPELLGKVGPRWVAFELGVDIR